MGRLAAAFMVAVLFASTASAAVRRAQMLRALEEMNIIGLFTGRNIVETISIGQSVLGQNIPLVIIKDPSVPIDSTTRIFIICRQHGNEPASTEGMLSMIRTYFSNPTQSDLQLLRKVTFVIVPMMNPDGAGRNCRRNSNNVDLNRDWLRQSQPETKAVISAINTWQPHLVIDAHELNRGDNRRDYIENVGKRSGTDPSILMEMKAVRQLILANLRTHGYQAAVTDASEPALPRLAHRYLPKYRGIPTLLIETRQSGERAQALNKRARLHVIAVMTAAHCLARDEGKLKQEISSWWQDRAAQLASRGKRNRPSSQGRGR